MKRRIEAIKNVYGLFPVLIGKIISFKNEEFSAWYVDGFSTFDDLMAKISLEDIELIYDGGK